MPGPTLTTARLRLRRWRWSDLEPLAAINADPEVMRYFPSTLNRHETAMMIRRIEAHFIDNGFGLWALDIADGASCIGFVGLSIPRFEAAFTPCVEIGWRLTKAVWGEGYATEAARAALSFGFEARELDEVVAFTVPANHRSRRVMEKLGMKRDPRDDFEHPSLPQAHPLRRHVLYRLKTHSRPSSS
ncbi:MAG: GNAT family N-acetyltransferase [Geminicoccaceae bacterium]